MEQKEIDSLNALADSLSKVRENKIIQQEKERKEAFNRLKTLYNNTEGRNFSRFLNTIRGKAPSWKKIEKYNLEELNYLLKSYDGNTSIGKIIKGYVEGLPETSETKKQTKIAKYNWDLFINKLSTEKIKLDKEIQAEKRRI